MVAFAGLGADCGCQACEEHVPQYPRVEKILRDYILQKLQSGESFYISDDLNSSVLKPTGTMGLPFLAPLIAAVATVGGTVAAAAAPIAAVAGTAMAVKNLVGSGSPGAQPANPALSNQLEAQVLANLQAQGIKLPSSISGQVVQAGVLDVFGPGTSQWVIMGLLIFAGILLMR